MFHPGALSIKRLKKQIFLAGFKFFRLHKKVVFHATDEKEKQFVLDQFGEKAKVGIAGNFPHIHPYTSAPLKLSGDLILGSIGLISPMKNHLLVLQALSKCSSNISYYIYG